MPAAPLLLRVGVQAGQPLVHCLANPLDQVRGPGNGGKRGAVQLCQAQLEQRPGSLKPLDFSHLQQ